LAARHGTAQANAASHKYTSDARSEEIEKLRQASSAGKTLQTQASEAVASLEAAVAAATAAAAAATKRAEENGVQLAKARDYCD
jgi:predicted  nucleic acid-binding Zn-ribbon protein